MWHSWVTTFTFKSLQCEKNKQCALTTVTFKRFHNCTYILLFCIMHKNTCLKAKDLVEFFSVPAAYISSCHIRLHNFKVIQKCYNSEIIFLCESASLKPTGPSFTVIWIFLHLTFFFITQEITTIIMEIILMGWFFVLKCQAAWLCFSATKDHGEKNNDMGKSNKVLKTKKGKT